ncbi:hypothetical protein BDA96_04G365400 [Sorghum bicolor]|uniref:Uncharacterized protein n=2 Tax=Sorghum bicolor TaxID=4558 RepID=A0A194YSW9_SORBI|nr:5-pentadecatrienyl resorcinol O-methyltransferase-like [Sorghum bicolor]KAG0535426.1 hypothetical protein BDA96_04G365400 [Sorghum bicolor]KXG31339.1 hypothetical protein SORBI_3004G341500 [Sorghum bicolor]|eukprot:XP_021314572.1 5-pentadecatrienyl resorcinol O-methyltransferase-like [Sorghum bicolor]
MAFLGEYSSQELLQGQLLLWHQSLGFFKSLALAVAMDLRIADAIHRLGGAATLPQIIAEAGIKIDPRNNKLRDLRRVMRALTVSGIFTVQRPASAVVAAAADGGAEAEGPVYKLTAASRLLVVGEKKSSTTTTMPTPSLTVQVQLFLETCRGSAFSRGMRAWFRPQDEQHQHQEQPAGLSPFAMACGGQTIWERAERDADAFPFDDAMASDTAFLMPIVLRECGDEVFRGLTSLVDVAGGLGGAAANIAAAFPDLKCTVLDLPQVVAKAAAGSNEKVQYVGGDMFESIPPADAVLLKWILHDWSDDECVKILKKCKQAIPPRAAGGKVIIIDMVVGSADEPSPESDVRHVETQVLFDLLIMCINGVERDELEWKKIFSEAGFHDYRIIPVLGVRSIIELYPN